MLQCDNATTRSRHGRSFLAVFCTAAPKGESEAEEENGETGQARITGKERGDDDSATPGSRTVAASPPRTVPHMGRNRRGKKTTNQNGDGNASRHVEGTPQERNTPPEYMVENASVQSLVCQQCD